jgi:hypothetical protein
MTQSHLPGTGRGVTEAVSRRCALASAEICLRLFYEERVLFCGPRKMPMIAQAATNKNMCKRTEET